MQGVVHNFGLTSEQEMVLDTVRRFVQDQAGPRALEHDEHGTFVREGFEQLGELGIAGLPMSEEAGGAGMGWLAFAVALEELARGCGSTARLLMVHAGQCGLALDGLPGGEDLARAVAAGPPPVVFVGPEFGARAAAAGEGLAVDGEAGLVTGAGEAESLLVAAEVDGEPALLAVAREAARTAPVPALGFRAAAPTSVAFEGAAARLLARGEPAAAALERAELASLLGAAAIACGLAQASREVSRKHAGERVAFGKPLAGHQAVAHKLAQMLRRIERARHLTYHAARLLDAGAEARSAAMLAKVEGVEAAVFCADEGIQIHGGYGFVVEYHVERHYRDAQCLAVLDGGIEPLLDRVAAHG